MMPVWWIALAYGVVTVTLLTYAIGLRRRLGRAEQARQLRRPGSSFR